LLAWGSYVVPADAPWEIEELGRLGEITVGFVGPMAHEYVASGIPFLRSLNVKPFRIDAVDLMFVSEAFHGRLAKSALKPGDVIIVRTGTPGVAAVVPEWLPRANCADLVVVHPGPRLDPRFLAYFVNGAAQGQIDGQVVGAVQQHYNIGSAKRMRVPLPPLDEQRAIATMLGTMDDKIDMNRRMNLALEEMASALFRSWFADFDPVVAKAAGREPIGMDAATAALFPSSFEDSELGPIPRGWTADEIYRASRIAYGAPFASTLFNSEGRGRPLIRIRDLADHEPEVWTSEEHPRGVLVRAGDIVVGMDGEFRAHVWRGQESWLNQRVCKFDSKDFYGRAFVYFSIKEPLAEVERSEVGTTVIHLGKADIDRFRVVYAPSEVHEAFHKLADPLLELAVVNGSESRSLAALRDALLPKLLSGEIRLRDAQRTVETVA
jgi:type I restriction enzyme S subunit